MAANAYEGMFILETNRYGRDPDAVSGQIAKMIEGAGGEILVSRLWEERRLAYSIKGHRKGTYWLTYFRLGADKLANLQRQCRLSESILRALFLKVDPRIVDTLVEHARAGHVGSVAKVEDQKPKEPKDAPKDAEDAPKEEAVAVAEQDDAGDDK